MPLSQDETPQQEHRLQVVLVSGMITASYACLEVWLQCCATSVPFMSN